jgi:hypothetical protein
MFVQLAGLIVPFVLLLPVAAPGFMEQAAREPSQVRAAILLLFANGAVTLGIAITLYPLVRDAGRAWGQWLLAASIAWFTVQTVDSALILSMLSLSEQYTSRGAAGGEALAAAGAALAGARKWTHYSVLLVVESWFLLFYGVLLRFALAPRVLAGLGVVMALVHAAAVSLPAFLDYPAAPAFAVSLAVSHLPLAAWLSFRGLRPSPFPGRRSH